MIRMQIQLTPEQVDAVKREARRRGISAAALIREAVDAAIRTADDDRWGRARSAVGRFASTDGTPASVEHDRFLEEAYLD